MKFLFPALLFSNVPIAADDYTLGPDSQPQPDVPKGTVTKYVLPPGKIYPATPHNYQLYIPAKYDASKPTVFMIFLDGSGSVGDGQPWNSRAMTPSSRSEPAATI